jgi:hypothetical protein
MMGRQEVGQAPLFYAFNLEEHVPANHLLRGIDQFLDLSELHRHLAPHYSHTGRPSVDPALADPDADRWLLLRYSLRASTLRRGAPESGLPLVLPAGTGRCRAGSLDVLEEPAWSVPRQRHASIRVRDGVGALPGRRACRRRRFRHRCQRHQGRCKPSARRPRQRCQLGPRVVAHASGTRVPGSAGCRRGSA